MWEPDYQRLQVGSAIPHSGGHCGPRHEIEQTPDVGTLLYAARFMTPESRERLAAVPPQRIVVVYNGCATGDSACRLAANLAELTGASVRAVTVLQPSHAVRMAAGSNEDPVNTLLMGVTQQLYRAIRTPGFWGLTLLVGRLSNQLEQACRDNQADLLILPEAECEEATAAAIGNHAAVAVMCVAASAEVVGSTMHGPSTASTCTDEVLFMPVMLTESGARTAPLRPGGRLETCSLTIMSSVSASR